MTAKELNQALETFFQEHKSKDCITYESIIDIFEKQPTAAQAKNVLKLANKHKKCLYTASEHAKKLNDKEAEARRSAQRKMLEDNETDEFDILKEHELLEWSRSDSPVRMYLREMGQIPLLTKEEEIEISKKIEAGESIIIDAICSVPYLIDFILDYKEPLINRERRVKELFRSFEDEKDDDDADESEGDEKKAFSVKTSAGIQDKASMELLLAQDLSQNKSRLIYNIVNQGEKSQYRFQKLGNEVVKTPAGTFNTVKIKVVRSTNARETVFWMAKELDYMPVKIRHREHKDVITTVIKNYKKL